MTDDPAIEPGAVQLLTHIMGAHSSQCVPMNEHRDGSWYRDEARRTRERAAAVNGDEQLRDSYLALAREYERLAQILESHPR